MTTKRKIILTILLAVLVGVLIFGCIGLCMQIPAAQKRIEGAISPLLIEELKGNYYEIISKLIFNIIITLLFIATIIGIWANWFIIKNFTYEEYKKYKLDKKQKKTTKITTKN